MNAGGGEAADQMVRMMLSTGEVAVKLGGSAAKNMIALTMALAQNQKKLSGKVQMRRMLRETRDIRLFPMSPEQYQSFKKLANRQKILYAAIRDKDDRGKVIDVVVPSTDVERANRVFEKMLYHGGEQQTGEVTERKKGQPSGRDSPDTRTSSVSFRNKAVSTRTAERPSVLERLKQYRTELDQKRLILGKEKTTTKQIVKTK